MKKNEEKFEPNFFLEKQEPKLSMVSEKQKVEANEDFNDSKTQSESWDYGDYETLSDNIADIVQEQENKPALSSSEKYEMLRNFLLSKRDNFTLRNDIDFWYSDFEFRFECKKSMLLNSTKEVKEYFENFGFKITQVSFRDYTYENSVHPLLKNEKKYKDGKKIYSVRVDKDSYFFEENADNFKDSEVEEFEPTKEEYSKKPVLNKGLILYIIIVIFMIFALIFALVLPHLPDNKKNRYSYLDDNFEQISEPTKKEYDYFRPQNTLDYDAETFGIPSYEYYNLSFETTEGTKEYQNAKFEIKDNNFVIKTYSKDSDDFFEFQGFEILPKKSIKNISGRKISD